MKIKQNNRLILPLGVKGLMLYILLLALGSCSSCRKEIDALPPETQTGANTFGCLVNGQAWIPNGAGGFSGIKPITVSGVTDKFLVIKSDFSSPNSKITLSFCITDYKTLGVKILRFDTPTYPSTLNPKNYGEYVQYDVPKKTYTTTSLVGGTVNITRFDEVNGIISGIFEFDVIDNTTQIIIPIKAGRFDINSRTL